MGEKIFIQPKKENFLGKKVGEKFIDWLKRKLNDTDQPFILEKITNCANCKQHINDESTEFFITTSGMPFDTIQCAVESAIEGNHGNNCTCEFCGSDEEFQKIYEKILPDMKEKVGQMTATGYAFAEAKKKLREQKILEYIEKSKKSE